MPETLEYDEFGNLASQTPHPEDTVWWSLSDIEDMFGMSALNKKEMILLRVCLDTDANPEAASGNYFRKRSTFSVKKKVSQFLFLFL